jgi:hypothetical protein
MKVMACHLVRGGMADAFRIAARELFFQRPGARDCLWYTLEQLELIVLQRGTRICELCTFEGCNNNVEHGGVCNMHCTMIKQINPETPYNDFVAL